MLHKNQTKSEFINFTGADGFTETGEIFVKYVRKHAW